MTWIELNFTESLSRDALSTTVYPHQKQLTVRLVIAEKYKGVECLFPSPIFHSVFTSFYLLLAVYFSPSPFLSVPGSWIKCDAINQNSKGITFCPTHFDWDGQKMKAERTEKKEKSCQLQLAYKINTLMFFSDCYEILWIKKQGIIPPH